MGTDERERLAWQDCHPQVDKLPEDSAALGAIEPGDSIPDWDNLELALGVKAGSAKLIALEVHELESARRSQ